MPAYTHASDRGRLVSNDCMALARFGLSDKSSFTTEYQ